MTVDAALWLCVGLLAALQIATAALLPGHFRGIA